MNHYSVKRGDTVQKWRKFSAEVLEKFPPQFLVVLLLVGLYIAFEVPIAQGFMVWVQSKIAIPLIIWKAAILVGAAGITYFRPSPRQTLALSLPSAVLSGLAIWYTAIYTDPVISMLVAFTCISVGVSIVAMILYQEQLVANEHLSEEIDHLKKSQVNNAADTQPPTH